MKKDSDNIKAMFDTIAPKYDFLNHLLSMGIDKGWRKKVVRKVTKESPLTLLDMATGTADLAIALSKKNEKCKIVGGDLSPMMLEVGRRKVATKGLSKRIELKEFNVMSIPFEDGRFDVVTAAFGVRNFENLLHGLSEMYRVTRLGGKIFILEFSKPRKGLISALYLFYFLKILPTIGRLISKNDNAYSYLPDSVMTFPCGSDFLSVLSKSGYSNCKAEMLSFGIATIYSGEKA